MGKIEYIVYNANNRKHSSINFENKKEAINRYYRLLEDEAKYQYDIRKDNRYGISVKVRISELRHVETFIDERTVESYHDKYLHCPDKFIAFLTEQIEEKLSEEKE